MIKIALFDRIRAYKMGEINWTECKTAVDAYTTDLLNQISWVYFVGERHIYKRDERPKIFLDKDLSLKYWEEMGKDKYTWWRGQITPSVSEQIDAKNNLPISNVVFFKLKNGKYVASNGIEITTEFILKHKHAIFHDNGYVIV